MGCSANSYGEIGLPARRPIDLDRGRSCAEQTTAPQLRPPTFCTAPTNVRYLRRVRVVDRYIRQTKFADVKWHGSGCAGGASLLSVFLRIVRYPKLQHNPVLETLYFSMIRMIGDASFLRRALTVRARRIAFQDTEFRCASNFS
jgi:hypothetical protein